MIHQSWPKAALLALLSSSLLLFSIGCSKDSSERDAFLGTYTVSDACTSGNYAYTITITADSKKRRDIIIDNFGDFGIGVKATVSGNNLEMDDIQLGTSFSGSGTRDEAGGLSISYAVESVTINDTCNLTATKQ